MDSSSSIFSVPKPLKREQYCDKRGIRWAVGRITTIMAAQLMIFFMIDHRYIAVFTKRDPVTFITFYARSIASAVLEKYDLFLLRKSFRD
jgi:hypothetical protein